jgi:transcriptional regulator with XRE-family HTH domain
MKKMNPNRMTRKESIAARKEMGLTQAELAALMGKPQPRVAEYENGNGPGRTTSFLLRQLLAKYRAKHKKS